MRSLVINRVVLAITQTIIIGFKRVVLPCLRDTTLRCLNTTRTGIIPCCLERRRNWYMLRRAYRLPQGSGWKRRTAHIRLPTTLTAVLLPAWIRPYRKQKPIACCKTLRSTAVTEMASFPSRATRLAAGMFRKTLTANPLPAGRKRRWQKTLRCTQSGTTPLPLTQTIQKKRPQTVRWKTLTCFPTQPFR